MKTGFIDWTEHALHLYIFDREGGRYALKETHSVETGNEPDPDTLDTLPKSGIDGIHLSVPSNLLSLREQTFPFSDTDKIRDTISFELEGVLLKPVSEYSIDHMIIETLDSGSRALAACIEKTRLRKIIDTFSSAGLEPRTVTCLDLRLAGGNIEQIIEGLSASPGDRANTAAEELLHPTINLRRDELSYTGDIEKVKRSLRVTSALTLVLIILFGAAVSLNLVTLKKHHDRISAQLRETYRSVFPEDKKIIDIEKQFRGNLNVLVKKEEALAGLPVLEMLRGIALNQNRRIVLHEFSADANNIHIRGTAGSFEDVEEFKNSLSASFGNIRVTDSGATPDKRINFTMIMREKRS